MPLQFKTPDAQPIDPRIERLVNDLIGRIADKWTMLILELLAQQGEMRFTQIGRAVEGISQKMLTQTLRQMERDGLVQRTVHPVVPPKVEYRLTDLGLTWARRFAASGCGRIRILNGLRLPEPLLTHAPSCCRLAVAACVSRPRPALCPSRQSRRVTALGFSSSGQGPW